MYVRVRRKQKIRSLNIKLAESNIENYILTHNNSQIIHINVA